jgi:cytochrome d ubiquinol oxidase subunit II
MESHDAELCEDFRRRAIGAGVAVFVTAGLVLLLALTGDAPLMLRGLLGSPWALPLHLVTGTAAITAFAAVWLRRYWVARLAAGLQVSLIVWGWALAQYPYLLPPDFTVRSAAAPEATLRLVAWALAAGALVLLPSLWYLFRVFKTAPADRPDAGH